MQTIIIRHTDGITPVKATAFVIGDKVELDWTFDKMSYGTTITKEVYESIKKKQTN